MMLCLHYPYEAPCHLAAVALTNVSFSQSPKNVKRIVIMAGLLTCALPTLFLPIYGPMQPQYIVVFNISMHLQLRGQLWIFTKFPIKLNEHQLHKSIKFIQYIDILFGDRTKYSVNRVNLT